ncbi:hypothetical protein A2483_02585 [Candidatus Peregrinibacteria bacterium RIFOXYC2_FULL_33_13]|nr:MAG: hypothetical protein UR27_C0027G0015 [Candidatus Peregrinibacteria bacterium GW2011_GWA2_33_10]KKP40139.1 MAG: hypothetical protein UR30_C0006G0044 [Candidatus Peregrinibacteria bacterium GW2011_GWC2_33_13]OGJ47760.1 MAG: hypothetical protein A2229_04930 [Candidatus Peregrinibacteria bacterium RIFOXYA2_FULL_33_7]OGJ53760.1 MAG: hypothetical protein A2483_02585 [Candidatus Peregrinibacteria bacterium RIFOXYC2_FULL_33_13]
MNYSRRQTDDFRCDEFGDDGLDKRTDEKFIDGVIKNLRECGANSTSGLACNLYINIEKMREILLLMETKGLVHKIDMKTPTPLHEDYQLYGLGSKDTETYFELFTQRLKKLFSLD